MKKAAPYFAILSFIIVVVQSSYNFLMIPGDSLEKTETTIISILIASLVLNLALIIQLGSLTKTNFIINLRNSQYSKDRNSLSKEVKKIKSVMDDTAVIHHNVNHLFREILNFQYELLFDEITDLRDLHTKFKQFLQSFTSNIKEEFDLLTDNPCSVCIYLLDEYTIENDREKPEIDDENNEKLSYHTEVLYRDPISYPSRSFIDKSNRSFPTDMFYPFKLIMDVKKTDNHFVTDDCNDFKPFYDSRYENFGTFYNSILCVPIRLSNEKLQNGHLSYDYLGFLVVDNKNGGINNKVCIETLKSYADQIYNLIKIYEDIRYFHMLDTTENAEDIGLNDSAEVLNGTPIDTDNNESVTNKE